MAGHFIIAVLCIVTMAQYAEASVHDWERWTRWTPCSATCDGSQQRIRHCIKHARNESISHGTYDLASHCKDDDDGNTLSIISSYHGTQEIQTYVCTAKCPVVRSGRASLTYNWDRWTSWTSCNATCDGTQYQIRACLRHLELGNKTSTNSVDISHCSRTSSGHYDYNRRACGPPCTNVNAWSEWSDWSACSATCDDGTRYRGRHCLGGDNCIGEVFDQGSCNQSRCLHLVDGAWGTWEGWGGCSTTCGLGYNVRYRSCNNPAPQDGGANCAGKHDQVRVCPIVECPIDGGWGNYTAQQCTVTCGVGVLVSVRKCDNPSPQYGGKTCVGASTKFDKCVNELCSVDGQWSNWSNFTDCTVVCGTGHIRRTRSCTNPPPQANGADCVGEPQDVSECDKGQCPSDIRICDKTLTQRLSSQSVSNTTSPSTICDKPSNGFALVETYCNAPADKSKWRLGIKIHDNCEMIPLYTPVGSSDNGVHVKEVGVMEDCFGGTLKMMTQSCNTDLVTKSYNLTDMYTSVHMILFEN